MSQINPFVGSIIQTPLAQRQQAAERSALTRHKQTLKKNAGLQGSDAFEHQVESAEAITPAHDGEKHAQDGKHSGKHDQTRDETDETEVEHSEEPKPHIDLTA